MSTEAHAALARLPEIELQRMIMELGRYALSVSSKLRWRTRDATQLPRGETVDSIVSLAFTKVLNGERQWDPVHAPDIKKYLMDVIDSLLYHLATSRDNTTITAIPSADSEHDTQVEPQSTSGSSVPAWHAQPPQDPEAALLHQEEERQNEYALRLLQDAVHDDPVVTQLIQLMREGYGKSGEIAKIMGIPVTDVYNALKRLDRNIVRVRSQLVSRDQ
ncbi:MAG: hypothetical protein V3S24_23250 [Candidatus Tectomicrobia bacterium]